MTVETTAASNGHSATTDLGEYSEVNPKEERRILQVAASAIASGDHPRTAPKLIGKRKAAIVGFAPTSIRSAPYANNAVDDAAKGYELIGLNELYKVPGIPDQKFSMWFDLHDRRDGDFSHRDAENIEWLAKFKGPVLMQDHYEDIPSSAPFPLHDAVRFFRTTYWTNSISYMLAYLGMAGRQFDDAPILLDSFHTEAEAKRLVKAIAKLGHLGVIAQVTGGMWEVTSMLRAGAIIDEAAAYGEIHVYGVDMAQEDKTLGGGEYSWQRPSCEYMIGFLRGMGIKVYVPRESDLLLTPFLYGYEGDGQAIRAKLRGRRTQLQEQSNHFKTNSQTNLMNAAATEGASKAFANAGEQLLKNGKISQADAEELSKHAELLMGQAGQMRALAQNQQLQQAGLDGALEDVNYTERALTGS